MGGQQAGVSSRPTAVAGAASRPAAPPMARFPFTQAQGSSQNVSQPPPRFPPSQAQGSSLNQVGGMVAGMGLRGRRHRRARAPLFAAQVKRSQCLHHSGNTACSTGSHAFIVLLRRRLCRVAACGTCGS